MSAPRAAERREAILERALEVFVSNGYVGTSTDLLASAASMSKQTLYREFGDKEGVFTALIQFACERIGDPFAPLVEDMRSAPSAREAINLIAEQFTRSIMAPSVQQLRRLVIAEAARFPELGQLYWERGFLRMIDSIGRCLAVLDSRGFLAVPDPRLAAHHFAGMLLWIPSNQMMFAPTARAPGEAELHRIIAAGSEAFWRAYRRADAPSSEPS